MKYKKGEKMNYTDFENELKKFSKKQPVYYWFYENTERREFLWILVQNFEV